MSRRTTKKQQREIVQGVQGMIGLVILGSLYYTRSLVWTAVLVILAGMCILFFAIYRNKKRRERLRNSGINEIDAMDGIQFEYYLKELFMKKGYSAEVTSAAGDYGGDVLISKGGKKVVVQAKRYQKDVGIKAVQEVVGAKAYYSADEAWVVSNSYFTKAAQELAVRSQVVLVNRDDLIDSILAANPALQKQMSGKKEATLGSASTKTAVSTATNAANSNPDLTCTTTIIPNQKSTCSKCGSPMVLRTGKRGKFLGCSNFPNCRFTKDVG